MKASLTLHGGAIGRRHLPPVSPFCNHPQLLLQLNFPYDLQRSFRPLQRKLSPQRLCRLTARSAANKESSWDEKPYEVSPSGKIEYLDEQDVVTFLDPPKDLIPLDPSSYNPAYYLWKKIEEIPEERRHRLLSALNPRLISRTWEIAGRRYDDPNILEKNACNLLSGDCVRSLELWKCRTSGAPLPIAWINSFEKAIFCCSNGATYGRLIGIINSLWPLYFIVRHVKEVMPTEQPCDLAYEFGDGLVNPPEYPQGFPKPAKHPWPFNDQVVIYVRYVGPGVMVGQAWKEGKALEQVPKKLCGEILMVKDFFASNILR